MTEKEREKTEVRKNARLFERLGWAVLLLCAVDIVLGLNFLGGMQVFLTTLAATFLIIGIVVRKQANKL